MIILLVSSIKVENRLGGCSIIHVVQIFSRNFKMHSIKNFWNIQILNIYLLEYLQEIWLEMHKNVNTKQFDTASSLKQFSHVLEFECLIGPVLVYTPCQVIVESKHMNIYFSLPIGDFYLSCSRQDNSNSVSWGHDARWEDTSVVSWCTWCRINNLLQ